MSVRSRGGKWLFVGLGAWLLSSTGLGCSEPAPPAPLTEVAGTGFASLEAQVLRPRCTAPCHSGRENAAGGLDLASGAHAQLVGVLATANACVDGVTVRVVPRKPEESLLYQKMAARLTGEEAPCGDPMPPTNRHPASASDLERVRVWIEEGALDD